MNIAKSSFQTKYFQTDLSALIVSTVDSIYYLSLKVELCPSSHERLDRSGMSVLRSNVKGGPTNLPQTNIHICTI